MITLKGEKIILRVLTDDDALAMTNLVSRNKHYWSVYEPRHDSSYYTVGVQREKIRESLQQLREKREYSFGIFRAEDGRLIGHISLYGLKRLPFLSAFVGYSVDQGEAGRGIATEALKLVLKFGFERAGLHRIEAYVSPRNQGSVRVLEKAGMQREGLLRQLLFINGVWEDHYLYAILEDSH
ncbi:GNAT family N-acetyltransferase [Bhargavaea massiliensis]|uniref:GNAT family N-acetyltransferase n=1 Tax=Bhargavaea massiliensis TaxID=2697500 RepID=UPI001BCAFC35|nr:GNAT family protein [Bhargavaea massiliensis]